MTIDDYPPLSPVATGIAGRCPRCGQGRMFAGFLTVAERCDVCGLDLTRHDAGDGPAVFAILLLGFLIVPIALKVESAFEPPMWLHAVLWPPVILAVALALLRPLKGFAVSLHFRHRADDDDQP